MEFDAYPGCFLIRVKGACNQGNWKRWPDLIDEAMKATVETYGYPDIIQVKSKVSGAPRARHAADGQSHESFSLRPEQVSQK